MEVLGFILIVGAASVPVAGLSVWAMKGHVGVKFVALSLGALAPPTVYLSLLLTSLLIDPAAHEPPPWTYLAAVAVVFVVSLPFSYIGGHLAWERFSDRR